MRWAVARREIKALPLMLRTFRWPFCIWRAANLPICEHGDQADFEACRLADLMLDRRDPAGQPFVDAGPPTNRRIQAPPVGPAH